MSAENRRTPEWLVERIALGELSPEELAQAKAALLSEPGGAERLAALQRSNDEILGAHPASEVTAEVRRRAHLAQARAGARKPRSSWLPMVLAVPLTAAVAFFVVTSLPEQPATGGESVMAVEPTRIKGEQPKLEVHRRSGGHTQALKAGDEARPGELLQLGYQRAGRGYGVVVSIDGAGAVTRHLPEAGDQSAALEGSGLTPLPHAYELDDAPDFERFFFVTADAPFELRPVFRAAQRLAQDEDAAREGALALPTGLEQTSLLIVKAAR